MNFDALIPSFNATASDPIILVLFTLAISIGIGIFSYRFTQAFCEFYGGNKKQAEETKDKKDSEDYEGFPHHWVATEETEDKP